jgi:hypothetical protein
MGQPTLHGSTHLTCQPIRQVTPNLPWIDLWVEFKSYAIDNF